MQVYLPIARGQMSSSNRVRAFLSSFHEQRPSATAQAMNLFKDDENAGPYGVFVSAVVERCRDNARVLDIGCGDGSLMEQLAERLASANITGIDLATTDIETAKGRLPEADFIVSDFLSYPFSSNAFDCVTAHMVLMLMGPLEAVLEKINRVLVPGGSLIFNFDDGLVQNESYGQLIRTAIKGVELAVSVRELAEAADRRLYDSVALAPLLHANGFVLTETTSYCFRTTVDANGAWQLVRDTYQVGALDQEQTNAARRSIAAEFNGSQREIELPLKMIVATRNEA